MRQLRFAVIGAGMAGILAAIKLRESGAGDVVIFEKADEFGGTWRENRYPGLACDVPSHLYSYSFAPNPDWSHRFAPGDEIRRYFQDVACSYGLDQITRFGEEVTSCQWIDQQWHLETTAGPAGSYDVVIAATGVLHHPNVPHFDGMESFRGRAFHSSRWDPDTTIDGQRVGVVGTGSTAVQLTGAIVDRVDRYTLFQRTPQWIFPQENVPYSQEKREQYRRDPSAMARKREEYSQLFTEGIGASLVDADSPQMRMLEDACRNHLEESVSDPELRERLRPDYRAGCKRLVMSGNFYQAIQHPNAELVTAPIERIEPDGVRTADGVLHELDVLVLATGFRVEQFIRPTTVTGIDGVDLDDVWTDAPNAYLSVSVPDFPNLFLLNGPNGPVGNFSLIDVAEAQMDYVMQLIDRVRSLPAGGLSATAEATQRFESERREAAQSTIWMSGCNSWYLDPSGVPATWPWSFDHFRKTLATPNMDDFEVVGAEA